MREVATSSPLPLAGRARALVELSRPGVLALVALTVPPVLVADALSPAAALGALVGSTLLAGGASAVNALWERGLDARMARTRNRPLPSGRVSVEEALAVSVLSLVASLGLLGLLGGLLPVIAGMLALFLYVGCYTVALKQRTAWQMPIGALAGAAPPLVADLVDGRVGSVGFAVFLLVFIWQIPHFVAIALMRRADYAAAGVPTCVSVLGAPAARGGVVLGALGTLMASLVPCLTGDAGWVYGTVAAVAGSWLCWRAVVASARGRSSEDRRSFFATIAHLTVVACALLVDLLAG